MFLLFKSLAFYSFSLFHFRSRKYVVFSWVLPLSFCLSFSLRPPGGGLYTVLNYSSFLEICVMERNCLGFIPAYSRNKMLYDFDRTNDLLFGIAPLYLHTKKRREVQEPVRYICSRWSSLNNVTVYL